MRILDLGCGIQKIDGAVGLDNVSKTGVDIVHDLLDFPYPIENESYDKIYLRHVVEHFYLYDFEKILNECFRILTPDGVLQITVPHAFSISAFTDPTHKRFFTFGSGHFWDKKHHKSYYNEINSSWELLNIQCKSVTWFDWKHYRLKHLDKFLSSMMKRRINRALLKANHPSLADRIIQKYNFQFVEIAWSFKKWE